MDARPPLASGSQTLDEHGDTSLRERHAHANLRRVGQNPELAVGGDHRVGQRVRAEAQDRVGMIGGGQVAAVAQRGRAGRVSDGDRRGRSQRADLDRHLPAGGVVHGVREDRGIGAAGAFLDHAHGEVLHALHRTHPRAEDRAHAGAILVA